MYTVTSQTLSDTEVHVPMWLLSAFGVGEPGDPSPNTKVYGGKVLLHDGPQTPKDIAIGTGMELFAGLISGGEQSTAKYSMKIDLMTNAKGERCAAMYITSSQYQEMIKKGGTQTQTATRVLSDGSTVEVKVQYDFDARKEFPYFGQVGKDVTGNLTMQQIPFAGETAITMMPTDTPFGTKPTQVDITNDVMNNSRPMNKRFWDILAEGLGLQ